MIFWNQKWAWWFTAVMFLLNNTVRLLFHTLSTLFSLDKLIVLPKLTLFSSSKGFTSWSVQSISTP